MYLSVHGGACMSVSMCVMVRECMYLSVCDGACISVSKCARWCVRECIYVYDGS